MSSPWLEAIPGRSRPHARAAPAHPQHKEGHAESAQPQVCPSPGGADAREKLEPWTMGQGGAGLCCPSSVVVPVFFLW